MVTGRVVVVVVVVVDGLEDDDPAVEPDVDDEPASFGAVVDPELDEMADRVWDVVGPEVTEDAVLAEERSVPDATRSPKPTAAATAVAAMAVVTRRTRRTARSRLNPANARLAGRFGGCSDTVLLLLAPPFAPCH